jgi:co-chaperonin GroES (HSP10)
MAKGKLLTSTADFSVVSEAPVVKHVPKVKDVKPCGSQVLVEILTPQELMGTNITLSDKTELKVPLQGYVRAVGPAVKLQDWGFNVGDRVLISGGGVMAPNYDGTHRDRFFMDPNAIKSVLAEANE